MLDVRCVRSKHNCTAKENTKISVTIFKQMRVFDSFITGPLK